MYGGITCITKRREVEYAFRKSKSELLPLSETKLKGNWEASWCGVNASV